VYLSDLLVSTVLLDSPQLTDHMVKDKQTKQWFSRHLNPTSYTGMNGTKCHIHQPAKYLLQYPYWTLYYRTLKSPLSQNLYFRPKDNLLPAD